MKLVLFDCDGTLVDSAGLIHATMIRTFESFDLEPPTLEATKSIIGLTLDIAIARLRGKPHVDDEALSMTARYKSLFVDVRGVETALERPFDGISEVISTLAKREEVLIGAVTGKSRPGLERILDANGWSDHFVVRRTADDCPSKPHPAMVTECCDQTGIAPSETVVIGDAVYDMQMAKAAGATAIGVSWGYCAVDDLWAAGADAVVSRPADLLSYIHKG